MFGKRQFTFSYKVTNRYIWNQLQLFLDWNQKSCYSSINVLTIHHLSLYLKVFHMSSTCFSFQRQFKELLTYGDLQLQNGP